MQENEVVVCFFWNTIHIKCIVNVASDNLIQSCVMCCVTIYNCLRRLHLLSYVNAFKFTVFLNAVCIPG